MAAVAATVALAVKGVTTGMVQGTTAVAAAPAPGMVVALNKMNSGARAKEHCLVDGIILKGQNGRRCGAMASEAAVERQHVVFHLQLHERDGGKSKTNVPRAETETMSVDVAVVINVMESSNRGAAAAAAADATIDRRRDNGDAIIAAFTLPSSSCKTTTMVL